MLHNIHEIIFDYSIERIQIDDTGVHYTLRAIEPVILTIFSELSQSYYQKEYYNELHVTERQLDNFIARRNHMP